MSNSLNVARRASQQARARLRRVRRAVMTACAFLAVGLLAAPAHAVTVRPAQPPGTQNLQTILNYAGWTVTTLCAAGFLAVAGTMALQHRRGEGGEHVGKLGLVMAAAVLGTAAGPIISALA